MARKYPEVRALCERARRPATMFLLGLGLLTTSGVLSDRMAQARAASSVAERVERAKAADAPLVAAWESNVQARIEREREEVRTAAVLAQEYRVPVGLAAKIHKAAVAEKVDPKVAFGLVRAESSFRRGVVSPVGAIGYTQLMPSTARWLEPGITRKDLFNEETNLRVGFKYLRSLMDKYDGNVRLALTAYNRGPGTVDKALRRGGNPDNGYAEMILTGKNAHQTGHAKVWLPKKATKAKTKTKKSTGRRA